MGEDDDGDEDDDGEEEKRDDGEDGIMRMLMITCILTIQIQHDYTIVSNVTMFCHDNVICHDSSSILL